MIQNECNLENTRIILTRIALKTRDVVQSNIHNKPEESFSLLAQLSNPTNSNGNSPDCAGN